MSDETLPEVQLVDSEDSLRGVKYEVTDGTLISAVGENTLYLLHLLGQKSGEDANYEGDTEPLDCVTALCPWQ